MAKTKKTDVKLRKGPITPELLPIPTLEDKTGTENFWNLYEVTQSWSKDELPESFNDELDDLLLRYGGRDCDGDQRLLAIIIDRAHDDVFHFEPVPSVPHDADLAALIGAVEQHKINLSIAQEAFSRALNDLTYRLKVSQNGKANRKE